MYATAEVKEVSRNRFRLETVSSDSAGANRIVTFNLPENAMLDTKSLRFFMDVACSGSASNGADPADRVYGKLPQNVSSLISRLEVYINGVQVQQGASEYNTIAQALRLGQSNLDKDNSTDRALNHSYITGDDANDDETVCVNEWRGFLGENSTRYLNTGLLGQIQIRLTFAGNHVLVPKQHGVDLGVNLSANAKLNASLMTYAVSNMYFTVDSVSLDPMYNEMLSKRLQAGGLELNYKEYYSFQLDGINSSSSSTRFSLSSRCIDRLYALYRDANYTETGIRSFALPNASGVSAYTSNALRFRSYSGDTKKVSNARWNWSVNNVKYPQYQASWIDGLADVGYAQDKVSHENNGTLITSKESFNDGKFLFPLTLCLPTGKGVAVQSGYNSSGVNTQMVYQASGQVIPPAEVPVQTNSGEISCFVIAESTAKLMIQLGRDLAVMW
ncbi:MAG: hypothetical protein O3A45_02400 [Proteobacteria bacterium]|nr:hypothetical protein [Pseudomonadota bacterium]